MGVQWLAAASGTNIRSQPPFATPGRESSISTPIYNWSFILRSGTGDAHQRIIHSVPGQASATSSTPAWDRSGAPLLCWAPFRRPVELAMYIMYTGTTMEAGDHHLEGSTRLPASQLSNPWSPAIRLEQRAIEGPAVVTAPDMGMEDSVEESARALTATLSYRDEVREVVPR
jgi:hypothetical protein